MSERNDWERWSAAWRAPAPPPLLALWHQARVKQRRMWLFTGLEISATLAACWQLYRLLERPQLDPRWRLFALAAFVLVITMQLGFVWLRGGSWSQSGRDMRAWLQLASDRARSGIRLAWLNIAGTFALLGLVLVVAWPDLHSGRWLIEPRLFRVWAWSLSINGVLVLATFWGCAWYIRRQRRRLRQIAAMRSELAESADSSG